MNEETGTPLPSVPLRPAVMPTTTSANVYELIGGEKCLRQMVDLFYDEMDANPAFMYLRTLHQEDLTSVRDKLFWFLSGFLGGPNLYIEQFGHPRLRARHLPFPIGIRERDQWLNCMNRAMSRMGFSDALLRLLQDQFFKTADWMRNKKES